MLSSIKYSLQPGMGHRFFHKFSLCQQHHVSVNSNHRDKKAGYKLSKSINRETCIVLDGPLQEHFRAAYILFHCSVYLQVSDHEFFEISSQFASVLFMIQPLLAILRKRVKCCISRPEHGEGLVNSFIN